METLWNKVRLSKKKERLIVYEQKYFEIKERNPREMKKFVKQAKKIPFGFNGR